MLKNYLEDATPKTPHTQVETIENQVSSIKTTPFVDMSEFGMEETKNMWESTPQLVVVNEVIPVCSFPNTAPSRRGRGLKNFVDSKNPALYSSTQLTKTIK